MSNNNDQLPAFNADKLFESMGDYIASTETITEPTQETKPEPAVDSKPEYDFEVLRLDATVTMPDGTRRDIPKKQALYRADDYRYLGSCSPTYNLTPHSYAVDILHKAIKETGYSFTEESTITKDGARLFHHVRFDDMDREIEGQKVTPQIIMINTYDGSAQFDIDLGAYRFVCSNGMRIGESIARTKARHTTSLNVEEIVTKMKRQLISYNDVVLPFYSALAEFDANKDQGLKIIEDIAEKSKFPERHTKKVIEEWNAPRTDITGGRSAWGIYNAFTSVITHEIQPDSFERGHQLGGQIMPSFEALVS